MNPKKLERSVENFCRDIINNNIRVRRRAWLHDGKYKEFWDLPRVAVVCAAHRNNSYKGYSKRVKSNTYDLTPDLKNALLNLLPLGGKIGDTNGICPYPVGNCAEPHAARECIKKENVLLNSIHFSTARIVTTGEIMPYCDNCKQTFPTIP